jgi:hypothetical protein
MTGRQDILDAFFAIVQGAAAWQDSSQRLRFWSDVPNQPAVFIRYVGDIYPAYEVRGLPAARMTMQVEVWIFAKQQDVDASAMLLLAPLIDSVIASLKPTGANTAQDLGLRGVVSHCWTEGRAVYDDAAVVSQGQAVAMIPCRIMVIASPG